MAWDYSNNNMKRNRDEALSSTSIKYWVMKGMKPQLLSDDGKPVDRTTHVHHRALAMATQATQDRLARNKQLVADMKAGE